jgi:hypothetical protein
MLSPRRSAAQRRARTGPVPGARPRSSERTT